MNIIQSNQNFISARELHRFLAEIGKTEDWFHNLSIRTNKKIFPQPIIKAPIQEKATFRKRSGREFYYPQGIKAHIKNIIRLNEIDGMPYKEISLQDEIIEEVARLNLQTKTGLLKDKRVRDHSYFENYLTAIDALQNIFKWGRGSRHWKLLVQVHLQAMKLRDKYCNISKYLFNPNNTKKNNVAELKFKKELIGQELDHLYSIMDSIIAHFTKLYFSKAIFNDGKWGKGWQLDKDKIK